MLSEKLLASSIVSALLTLTVSAHAIAADNPGAHQHGHAEMQLAFSADRVEILLMSPAANILGFEHRPRTPEQQQMVESVTSWLEETPLVNTPELTCTVKSTSVQYEVEGGHNHNEHGHDHDKHDHDGHDNDDEDRHTDITVTQTLSCPGLDKAPTVTTPLTTRFPRIEDLDIAWAGPGGQGATRLEHGAGSFSPGR